MVNNATNINKTKESLDSDGQQCHEYQQNKRKFRQWWSTIPRISTKRTATSHLKSLITKGQRQMSMEIQSLAWDSHKKNGGVEPGNVITPLILLIIRSPRQYKYKESTKQTCTISLKNTMHYHINDWQLEHDRWLLFKDVD